MKSEILVRESWFSIEAEAITFLIIHTWFSFFMYLK